MISRTNCARRAEHNESISMKIPVGPQYRTVVSAAVAEMGALCGLSGAETEDIVSAAREAFDNASVHGYLGRREGIAELRIHPGEGRLVVEVVDRGRGFPYRLLLHVANSTRDEGDCGFQRMRRLVDEVSVRPNLPHGTVVTLVKTARA